MRKLLIATMATAVFAAPAYAATKTVKVGDDWFVSKSAGHSVTVSKGTTVRWSNTGDSPHTVKAKKGPVKFKSGTLFPGDVYRKKMKVKGTYTIVCTIHTGQKMTLRVK